MGKLFILSTLLIFFFSISNAQKPTYYRNIAPIINNKCASCHRPGDAAPFSLLSYEDVVKRGSFIKEVVKSGYMPPWKVDNHYTSVPFLENKSLTDKEKELIIAWIDDEMPKGVKKSSEIVQLNKFQEGTSYSRNPDTTISVVKSYNIIGDSQDRFIVFKIPFSFSTMQNVEAIEFISKNKSAVHHANFAIYNVDDSTVDINSGPDFINNSITERVNGEINIFEKFKRNMVYYGGWVPGSSYEAFPKGLGWVMPKRGVVLLTIHYAPIGKDEIDFSKINLFFTKDPIQRTVELINLGSGGIAEQDITPYFRIPADSIRKFDLRIKNPKKQTVIAVWPHMHLLGKSFKAYALTDNRDTIKLISIPKWDFNWQSIYRYEKPLIIPENSTLVIEGSYDNTVNNPKNPRNPPVSVYGSGEMKSTDEMLTLILIYLKYENDDENLKLTYKL